MSKRVLFENDYVEGLVISWKWNRDFDTYKKICSESANLIDSIIRGSRFNLSAPFHDIRNFLFLQFERWIEKWVPGEGKLYTYMSVSIKNGCMGFVAKEKLLHQRFVFTDVPLDGLGNEASYEGDFNYDLDEDLRKRLSKIVIRWHEPLIVEVAKFMIYAVLKNRGVSHRKHILRTASEVYGLQIDDAKFLLDWSHGAVRSAFLDHYDHPLSFTDMLAASGRFSLLKDVMDVIGFEASKKLFCAFAGATIKLPPASQLLKFAKVSAALSDVSRGLPEEVAAKKRGLTTSTLYETIESILSSDGILEDKYLYAGTDEVPTIR